MSPTEVNAMVATIQIGCDGESPFRGMIDFSSLKKLKTTDAQQVWDAMGPKLQKKFTKLYMSGGES